MLTKRHDAKSRKTRLAAPASNSSTLDRRSFLARSGLTASGLAGLSSLTFGTIQKAEAAGVRGRSPAFRSR